MIPVISVENMRASDAATIQNEIPSRELMKRAGDGIFAAVSQWREPVAVVCGSGNNAGDGYVVALNLQRDGIECELLLLDEKFSEDGLFYFNQCIEAGINWRIVDESETFEGYGTIVDCIFGTGFHGAVRGKAKALIDAMNASSAYVVSADINSGLSGDSGKGSTFVESDLTVSIGYYQPGHFLHQAKDARRALVNCDIGIKAIEEPFMLWEEADVAAVLGNRKNCSHKGDYGYVTILGGSEAYSGAVKLANLGAAAARAGAGVVRLAAPAELGKAISPYILESTFFPMASKEGALAFDEGQLAQLIVHQRALAFGMGVGRSEEIGKILSYLLSAESKGLKLIIDADGLYPFSTDTELLNQLKTTSAQVILTPHVLEFSRLCKMPVEEILEQPIKAAKNFAAEYHVTLLLKGPTTIITDGSKVYLSDRGCPGMATAGSGDVLSGVLAAMAGYIASPIEAATAAAFVTGMAGELAQAETNPISMVASDTASCVKEDIT